MTLYLGNNLISGVATPTEPTRNLGQIIESIVPLTDAGLHLLDGSLINGSGIYSAFVDAIADLETDYPDLFETEANWQSAVTTYGVCGKFVYDSVANTVRLPKITGIIEGTTDVTALGDLVQAGLPNITGTFTGFRSGYPSTYYTGAFIYSSTGDTWNLNGGGNAVSATQSFDASHSNSIYGNSNTVQPQTIKCYYYIVIATSTKTEIEVDIDQVTTDLNSKADVDLSNLSNGLANTICTTKPLTISSASSAKPAVIIENYINGTSWYRVWSDGWCEQGGNIAGGTDNTNFEVTLLKAYADTNYDVGFTSLSNNSSTYGITWQFGKIFPSTISKFICSRVNFARGWRACGYII